MSWPTTGPVSIVKADVVGNGHLNAGMHLLTKPFSLDALGEKLRQILPG